MTDHPAPNPWPQGGTPAPSPAQPGAQQAPPAWDAQQQQWGAQPAPAAPPVAPPAQAHAPVAHAAPEPSRELIEALGAVRAEVGRAVVGQDAAVTGLVIALLCRGHVLLEGVPGVAKTLLVRTLSAALDLDTKRVQFTPDLMPGDVTGSLVYDARTAEFSFREGPVFTNLMLADEINRTPPKTQASLLEAMEERQVSVDGTPRPLPDPFIVIATQNPVEYEGTYPLPEAQLDRFLLKLTLPLPERHEEIEVLARHASGFDPRDLRKAGVRAVAGKDVLERARQEVARVQIAPEVLGYVVDVVRATRQAPSLSLGVSPRGATALIGTARAWAWLSGRSYVTPDDVKALAHPTLRHRVQLRAEAELEGVTAESVLDTVLASVPVPAEVRGVAITWRAVALTAVGVLPVALWPVPGTVLAWAVLCVLLCVVDTALAASPRAVAIRREVTGAVRLHEPARSRLTVTHTGRRRLRALVRDAWQPSAGAAANRHRVDLPPGESRRLDTALRPTRRGDLRADRVTIRALGPLGLAGRQTSIDVPGTQRVLPEFASRRHLPSRLARLREMDGRAAVQVRGQGTEFDSLREYVIGDDVRSIDWRASARRADVVVRTWRPERDRRVLIVLDTSRTSAARTGEEPRLEPSVEAALLLAALAARAGDRVELLAYDRTVRARVAGASGPRLMPAIADALADVEPSLVEADWPGIVAQVQERLSQRALVVLLSALDPAAVENGLLRVVDQLAARHQVVLASVQDPEVERLRTGREDVSALFDAAAAERTGLERAAVAVRLRSHGVEVVDALPDDLAPRLADTYLALKAAGRL